MELWSGLLSNNAAKVRIALAEKGLEAKVYNLEWTRANAWGEKPHEFLAVSPRGQVPVLIDRDLVVYDSTVINEYLDEQYPEPPLMPEDVRGRTLCRIWEDEADHIANIAIATLIARAFVGGEPEHPEVARAMEDFQRWSGRLSKQLGEKTISAEASVSPTSPRS
ncbi:MAG: glutathione S-transferase family protein [Gammaproteobacteria bacterium]|nr:glutathione S-transferase family protein [Gammaproteobacteria bacterium]